MDVRVNEAEWMYVYIQVEAHDSEEFIPCMSKHVFMHMYGGRKDSFYLEKCSATPK